MALTFVYSSVSIETVIPGRAEREPGIYNHKPGLWIPGLRLRRIPE
ncbi:hypothetical protein [Bradyrhizobium cosmicum]|nr:hypothetical protein [Bradyrhizobium cosmicum]